MIGQPKPKVAHLIDDTTAGGVMRVLDHLTTSSDLAEDADHRILKVKRGRIMLRRIKANMIVSHLSISWRTLPALLALRLAHPFAKIVHVEHSYTGGFVEHNVQSTGRFYLLLRLGFWLFDKVIAVSKGQADWLQKMQLVKPAKLTVIRSYVDLSPFEKIARPKGPIRHFGAIGRLDRQKGFDVIIQAFRTVENPELRLSIYGEGPEETALRQLAGDDPRIVFEGFASHPVAPYAEVDAVVMPSRWEAYGLVAIETLASGRKLVCSGIDGLIDHAGLGADYVEQNKVCDWATKIQDTVESRSCPVIGDPKAGLASESQAGWKNSIKCL
ncbi:glycosyltransferase [Yoonia sp. BS5-3]|uniref:Glycosyltransferase n=1 Tax=Yoonia phaeophyticola TaxID=3137369 RepID=A0ABZ2V3B0_9RHOB